MSKLINRVGLEAEFLLTDQEDDIVFPSDYGLFGRKSLMALNTDHFRSTRGLSPTYLS